MLPASCPALRFFSWIFIRFFFVSFSPALRKAPRHEMRTPAPSGPRLQHDQCAQHRWAATPITLLDRKGVTLRTSLYPSRSAHPPLLTTSLADLCLHAALVAVRLTTDQRHHSPRPFARLPTPPAKHRPRTSACSTTCEVKRRV